MNDQDRYCNDHKKNACAPDEQAVPALLVTPNVLLLSIIWC